MAKADARPIIIKKIVDDHGHGHHGGAWKVAYADFVTAMMAFFLLLWLLNSTTIEQRAGIADFFTPNPAMSEARSGAGGMLGGLTLTPEGAGKSNSAPLTGFQGLPSGPEDVAGGHEGAYENHPYAATQKAPPSEDAIPAEEIYLSEQEVEEHRAAVVAAAAEKSAMAGAADSITAQISAVAPELARSLRIDDTPDGLRIQLLEQEQSPLFEPGGTVLTKRAERLLKVVAVAVQGLPNPVILRGHTDASGGTDNWSLSAARANAARQVMERAGLGPDRVQQVVGLAATEPFIKENPLDARNRRVSITLVRLNPPPER